jgi:hypothetical protein
VDGSVPEEEPFEKAVALDASEEEGLRRGVGAWIGEHGQLPLDLLHLLRCHGCFASAHRGGRPSLLVRAGRGLVGIEPKGTRERERSFCGPHFVPISFLFFLPFPQTAY